MIPFLTLHAHSTLLTLYFQFIPFSTLYGNHVYISSILSIHRKLKPTFIFEPQQHLTHYLAYRWQPPPKNYELNRKHRGE